MSNKRIVSFNNPSPVHGSSTPAHRSVSFDRIAFTASAVGVGALGACFLPWRTIDATGSLAYYVRQDGHGGALKFDLGIFILAAVLVGTGILVSIAMKKAAKLKLSVRTLSWISSGLFLLAAIMTSLCLFDDWFGFKSTDLGTMNFLRGFGLWTTLGLTAAAAYASWMVGGPTQDR